MRSKNPNPSGSKAGARIGICEASVASIHKLAMSPRVFVRTYTKKVFLRFTLDIFNMAKKFCPFIASKFFLEQYKEVSNSKEPKKIYQKESIVTKSNQK